MSSKNAVSRRRDRKSGLTLEAAGFQDKDWLDRIAKAKEARRAGQEARKGKPPAFSTHMFR